jgi:hypothetical protein
MASPSVALTSATTNISTFAAFAPIEPMKVSDLNEAGIKRCRDALRTRDANNNGIDVKKYFAVVRENVSTQFQMHRLWDSETEDL